MNYKNLHTHTLEQLFGPISLNILKQNETIRIVELKDQDRICKTLALVRFLNIHGIALKEAYDKIIEGGLLGQTLYDYKIDFEKEFIGSISVKLPDWLQADFKTHEALSFGFISNIWVKDESVAQNRFLFSEIIEIIPPELKKVFIHKIKPLQNTNKSIMSMLNEAKIEMI
ncbi:hypothetical protein ACS386_04070 [Flavobacteriaceae bacterium LMO-SS05]